MAALSVRAGWCGVFQGLARCCKPDRPHRTPRALRRIGNLEFLKAPSREMEQDQYYYIYSLIFLTGVQLALHSVRARITLGAFFGLAGVYSILLWQMLQTGWWVTYGDMNFNAGTTLFIPSILLGSLLAFAFDGLRVARSYMLLVAASCMAAWLFSVFREHLAQYVPLPYLVVLSSREHLSIIVGLMFAQMLGMASYLFIGKWKYATGLFVALLLSTVGWLAAYSAMNFGIAMGWANFGNDIFPFMLSAMPAAIAVAVYGRIAAKKGLKMPLRNLGSLLAIWRPSESNLSGEADEMISRDKVISELKLLNRESETKSRLMDHHMAHASYGVVITDSAGKVLRTNEPANRLFGCAAAEGRDFSALFNALCGKNLSFSSIVKECGGKRWEASGGESETRWYELIATPLKEGDTAADTGYYLLVVDVTSTVHEEGRMLVSKRIRDLNQTGRVLSHDLSNLLMGADAQLRKIGEKVSDPESLGSIKEIFAALGHAREMLNQIGAGSQFGTPRLRREEIGEIVRRALGILRGTAEEEGVRLIFEEQQALYVDADSNQLTRVFTNLIKNAIRASPKGGQIVVTAARKGSGVEVVVADEGGGMTAEEMEKAFDPAYSTKGGGKGGLGLAISYLMVDAHGGHLDLANSPGGKGMRAVVRVPESRECGAASGVVGKNVIVASAHPKNIRWLIAELEENNKCHVAEAYNEDEVAALLAEEERWDVLFLGEGVDLEKIRSAAGARMPDVKKIRQPA